MVNIDDYQKFTETTWINGETIEIDINHALAGLSSEAGEVAGCYQKFYRGDYDEEELRDRLHKEFGGLLYYIARLSALEGFNLSDIINTNRDILLSRKKRGVIKGDGDNR